MTKAIRMLALKVDAMQVGVRAALVVLLVVESMHMHLAG